MFVHVTMDNLVWRFYLGACLLTTAMLQPLAPAGSIVAGMGLAALVLLGWILISRHRSDGEDLDKPGGRRNRRDL